MTGIPVWRGGFGTAVLVMALAIPAAAADNPGPKRVFVQSSNSSRPPASAAVKAGIDRHELTLKAQRKRRLFPHHLFAEGAEVPGISRLGALREESASVQQEGVLRLAVIRVDFLQDSPADSSTGNGRFDFSKNTGIPVDPPPHNRAYFEAHTEALRLFYLAQSYDTVDIQATVFPPGDTTAYHLEDTAIYGPWNIGQTQAIVDQAERFVTDAILAADASGDIDFSQFDEVMIFHAGADFQGDVYDDTPYDVPSFTLTYGIPLQTATAEIHRANVLPETTSQDDLLGALNGVVAHEMGHLFGLPDLYNIFNGAPQVGWFSLMDSGENISVILVDEEYGEYEVRGVFPTSLDPWCKIQAFPHVMELDVVGEHYAAQLEAVQVNSKIPLVSIDPAEYFLVENRALDLDGNDSTLVRADSLTGVLMGPVNSQGDFDPYGSREYDAVLPGGGVAIWHVDETLVLPALADRGQINQGLGARGVALEEADGVWDIGYLTAFPWGQPNDLFFGQNNARLAPDTVPSSESNRGAYTGIEIKITGDLPAIVMGLEVNRPLSLDGWPIGFQQGVSVYRSAVADFDGDGRDDMLVGVSSQSLVGAVVFDESGQLIPDGSEPLFTHDVNLTGAWAVANNFVLSPGQPERTAATVDEDGRVVLWGEAGGAGRVLTGVPEAFSSVVLASRGSSPGQVLFTGVGRLVAATPADNGVVEIASTYDDLAPIGDPAVIQDPESGTVQNVAAAFGRSIDVFDLETESVRSSVTFSRLVRSVIAAPLVFGRNNLAVASGDSVFVLDLDGNLQGAWSVPGIQHMIAADLDRDGVAEVVTGTDEGELAVTNADGTSALSWPVRLDGEVTDLKTADFDSDGLIDLMAMDSHGVLHVFSGDAVPLPGFPRAVGPLQFKESHLGVTVEEGLIWTGISEERVLLAQRLPESSTITGDWRHPRGSQNGAQSLSRPDSVSVGHPAMGSDQFIVFPNPVHGDQVELRFMLDSGQAAEIEIVDVRGSRLPAVLTAPGPDVPGENSRLWHLNDVAPGLYYCKLTRSGGSTSIVPVAVIR